MRFDWKLLLLVLINVGAIAVQWGTNAAKLDELYRREEQQERHLEFIDNELRMRGEAAGEAKGFHDATIQRLDSIDKRLERLENRR